MFSDESAKLDIYIYIYIYVCVRVCAYTNKNY